MESYFNKDELLSIIHDFYILTHIRITIFDADYNEILSYPDRKAGICDYLRKNIDFDHQCFLCDRVHMEQASRMSKPYIYTCHAGITEIISPLLLGEKVVGFLFFSHIFNFSSHDEALKEILSKTKLYLNAFDPAMEEKLIHEEPLFDSEYLKAAARLLQETASYVISNRMAYLKYEDLSAKIDKYIKDHLAEDLSSKVLCDEFGVGKTYLYQLTNELYGEGLAEHIRKLRVHKAMDMIRENKNIKISAIASEVGFDDYSYFIVIFKKETGMTPKKFQTSLRS
jgi:AraC-like DNA-binding protein